MKRRTAAAGVLLLTLILLAAGILLWRHRAAPAGGAQRLPPTARGLIAAALRDGRIDYGTSLLYRAYALFRDERLPQEFRGRAPFEDNLLFHEAVRNAGRLSQAARDSLRPFLVRPDDPASVFNTQRGRRDARGPGDLLMPPVYAASDPCEGRWVSQRSTRIPLKVWACGSAELRLMSVLEWFEESDLWNRMTALMGQPLLDGGRQEGARVIEGGDNAIDLYLAAFRVTAPGGRTVSLQDRAVGMAYAVMPPGNPYSIDSSGYMVADTSLSEAELRSTIVHEFFHILQYRHNTQLRGIPLRLPDDTNDYFPFWFSDASATWAEAAFLPETADEVVHPRFADTFQHSVLSLHDPDDDQRYAAYIWPLFVEQERGAAAIAAIWRDLRSAGEDWDAAHEILNRHLPFDTYFRRFARRNLNSRFDSAPGPLDPLYDKVSKGFPVEVKPFPLLPWMGPDLPASDEAISIPTELRAVKAAYYRFSPADDVQQVEFDLSSLAPSEFLRMDAVIHLRSGRWRLIEVDAHQPSLKLCRSRPDEDFDEAYVILSNHAIQPRDEVKGTFTVMASDDPCACGTVEMIDNRVWIDKAVLTGPGVSGQNESTETSTARFVVEIDRDGTVRSSGSSLLAIDKSGSVRHALGSESSTEQSRDVTKVVEAGGRFDIGPLQPDGSYVIEVCTAATETQSTHMVTSSKQGNRSDARSVRNDGGVCARVEGRAAQAGAPLIGEHREPGKLRSGESGSSYSRPGPSGHASGSVSGAWVVSWNIAACAPRQR